VSFWNALKLILTLHCEQSSEFVSASLDRELSAVELWAVRLHTIGCKSCRRFIRQVRFLEKAAKRHFQMTEESVRLPADAKQRILSRLRQPPKDDQ
jgi:predicted anti-sigma-YlaC factor YlaD